MAQYKAEIYIRCYTGQFIEDKFFDYAITLNFNDDERKKAWADLKQKAASSDILVTDRGEPGCKWPKFWDIKGMIINKLEMDKEDLEKLLNSGAPEEFLPTLFE